MTAAPGIFGVVGLSLVGFIALMGAVFLVQIVALYAATLFSGLIASPGRAFLAFLGTLALSAPGVVIISGMDLGITAHDALTSLINLGAGTVSVKFLYDTGFGLALLTYGLAAALSLAAMSAALLVLF